jgi:hypothetical protein
MICSPRHRPSRVTRKSFLGLFALVLTLIGLLGGSVLLGERGPGTAGNSDPTLVYAAGQGEVSKQTATPATGTADQYSTSSNEVDSNTTNSFPKDTINPTLLELPRLNMPPSESNTLDTYNPFAVARLISSIGSNRSTGTAGSWFANASDTEVTDSRGSITVHAAGRGNPWINLSDGRAVLTGYSGATDLPQVLEQNLARPRALASADFDEDGAPDLIGTYAGPGGGIITLHRGNVDSIYPNAPEAQQRKANGTYTDSPFLSPAHAFGVPEAADFVGTGDFDADSHWDVVAAARGGNAL